jgi:hypothetical protein
MKYNIEGYEDMSLEEKVAALEAYEPTDMVSKATLDKVASEAADYKKKWREAVSAEEAKAAEAAEANAAIMAELESLRTEKKVAVYTNSFLSMGYDEKLAKSSAEALAKGDVDAVFKFQKLHLETREKALRTELLKGTPSPAAGKTDSGKTKEEFSKMTLAEKTRFAEENPEAYNEFYGGK